MTHLRHEELFHFVHKYIFKRGKKTTQDLNESFLIMLPWLQNKEFEQNFGHYSFI